MSDKQNHADFIESLKAADKLGIDDIPAALGALAILKAQLIKRWEYGDVQ